MISHQEKMLELSDKIILLSNGEIEKTGAKEDIMSSLNFSVKSCKGCGV